MSLSLALNNALSGLNVNQAALAVVSNNIANANTPGYSRQIIDQSSLVLDAQGSGAQIDSISRKIDVYLERSIQRESSNVGQAEEIADYYERIQILLGEPGSDNSIDEYVQSFFNSLQSLAESPDRVSIQAASIDTAEVLAREISGLAAALEDLRFQADQDIDEAVKAVNLELTTLTSLNVAINRAQALDISTASLLDERDAALEVIASYINIDLFFEETGAVNVFTTGGVALVDDAPHELRYVPATGLNEFVNNNAMNPLEVLTFDDDGNITATNEIISRGVEDGVSSRLTGGSIEGLRELRDELIPDILAQLDTLAAGLRDAINAVHNDGSGFPPADDLTGTRLVTANEFFDWTGTAQISVLNADGSPVTSPYSNEQFTGFRPLDLNFDLLDSGFGDGIPTMQTIIDEINNHFNAPPVKASLNNLNNIQLAANSSALPGGAPVQFNFDLDFENIANFGTETWITDVVIADDTGATIASEDTGEVTNTAPDFDIASYDFTNASSTVTVNTTGNHTIVVGDRIYLDDPGGGPYAGGTVPSSALQGFFEVTAVTGTTFEIDMTATLAGATSAGEVPATAGTEVHPVYQEVGAGEKIRGKQNGTFTADLSGNPGSEYFDITVTVGTFNQDPNSTTATQVGTLTYRIPNNTSNMRNDRFDVLNAGPGVTTEFPGTPHQYIFARLVDENGTPLPTTNGSFGGQQGYLQLVANDLDGTEFVIAIDEGTSRQEGTITDQVPPITGTNRGFSHYFELNNLFSSNEPSFTGDTVTGSAINLAVEERLIDNPSLISTGQVELSNQPVGTNAQALYTYERYIGNNSVAQRLAEVSFTQISFEASGGLPNSNQTINGYIGEILGFTATRTVSAQSAFTDVNTLFEGLVQRADAISGVNLDEELASTTIYQNAYSASARVISVTEELFDALFGAFN